MAASLITRVINRATRKDAAIRAALARSDSASALWESVRALTGEAKKVRGWRPADAALIDAELAGTILALAAELHDYKPARPDGCRSQRHPEPEHLTAAYEASLTRAAEEAERRG